MTTRDLSFEQGPIVREMGGEIQRARRGRVREKHKKPSGLASRGFPISSQRGSLCEHRNRFDTVLDERRTTQWPPSGFDELDTPSGPAGIDLCWHRLGNDGNGIAGGSVAAARKQIHIGLYETLKSPRGWNRTSLAFTYGLNA